MQVGSKKVRKMGKKCAKMRKKCEKKQKNARNYSFLSIFFCTDLLK